MPGVEYILDFVHLTFVQAVLFLAAVVVIRRRPAGADVLVVIVGFALLFRGLAMIEPPNLSRDVYRYVWDGRVQAHGFSPYRHPPSHVNLAHLRDAAVYDRIVRRDYALSAYPPAAQLLFWLTTRISESVTWMKFTMVLFDLTALVLIGKILHTLKKPLHGVVVYAWHPVVIWEIAGNGHLDAASTCWLVAALYMVLRGRRWWAGFATGLGALTKLLPLVALPAVARGRHWACVGVTAVTVLAGYAIYVPGAGTQVIGFLPNYVQEERMDTGGRFFLLSALRAIPGVSSIPAWVFLAGVALILGILALRAFEDRSEQAQSVLKHAFVIVSTVTIAMSQIFPWYYVWVVPFLTWRDNLPMLFLTLMTPIFYLTWLGESWDWSFGLNAIAMIPTFALMAMLPFLKHKHEEIS